MKRNILATLLVLAAVAFSCTPKEEAKFSDSRLVNDGSVVYNPTVKIQPFEFEGDTKTVLTIDDNTGAKFTFEQGDLLGVYPYSPEAGDQISFSVKEITASSCTFNGNGFCLQSGQLYAAYYPLCDEGYGDVAQGISSGEMMTQIPVDYTAQVQSAKNSFDISAADYMVAYGMEPVSGVCNFNMSHIGALLVMDVTFPEAGTFTELSINATGATFLLTACLDVRTGGMCPDMHSSTATLSLGNGISVAANETVRFCMMIAPADLRDASEVTLSLKDDNNVDHSASIVGKYYKAGYAYKIECTLDAAAPAVPTNLSELGTANCYIVDVNNINTEGYYFDCTVAGNGQTVNMAAKGFANHANVWPQINGAYTSALPAAHPTDIRVTLNQNNCISDVAVANGTITFKATGARGNAKILMMDAANDDPAWVWHIWCTDQPAVVTVSGWSSWGYSYNVMDRNIGAIRATFDDPTSPNNNPDDVCGFYYQGGNPTGWTYAEYCSASYNDKGWRMVDGIAGAEKRHKPYLDISSDFYWFNPYASTAPRQLFGILWGGGSAGDGTLNRGPAAVKTMYDPCPVGYKVMPIDGFGNIVNSDSGDQYGFYKDGVYFPYNGGAWDGGTFWMTRGYVPDGDTARYMNLWTSGHNNSNMWYEFQAYAKDVNRAGGGTVTDHILARGFGVRCVEE